MTTPFRTMLQAGVACLFLHLGPATAADVTPAQATEVEGQLRTWVTSILGPTVAIAPRPIELTPAGDHFDARIPIRVKADGAPATITVTAAARPIDGGKWSIESIRTAMPVRFTIDMPQPPVDGKPAIPPTVPVTYSINIAGQDGQLVLDPSFNTPTTYTSSAKGGTIRAEGGPLSQETRVGPVSTVTTIRPAGPDKVDVATDGTIQDYDIRSDPAGLGPLHLAMKLVRVNMGLTGVNRARATTMTQNMAAIFTTVFAATPDAPPKIAPEVARSLLAALQDLASAFNLDETIEGLAVNAAGTNALLEKASIGFGAKSDDGILQARMLFGMEGLTLPGLDLGPMAALIPTNLTIRPFASGIGVAELMRILASAGNKQDPDPADIAALFNHGGIVGGIESLALEVAGATFTAQGKLTFTSPQAMAGDAQVTAEDFDDLMEKLSEIPQAAQFIPLLAMAKGIGKTVEDKLVWNITYNGGKTLVNNVDVMQLLGGGGGGPPSRGPQKSPAPPRKRQ